jgi:hypothetical protein
MFPRYIREIGTKIWLAYNEFEYKKSKDDFNSEDRFLKKENSQSHMRKIADKNRKYPVFTTNTFGKQIKNKSAIVTKWKRTKTFYPIRCGSVFSLRNNLISFT